MTATAAKERAKDLGERVAESDLLQRLARCGLVGRGVLAVAVGLLVLRLGLVDRQTEADPPGALATIAGQPLGRVLLAVVAVTLAGAGVWHAIEAVRRHTNTDGGWHRALAAFEALLYAAFAVFTAAYAVTGGQGSSQERQRDVSGQVLSWSAGRWLVAVAGVVVLVAGLREVLRAVTGRFRENVKDHETGPVAHGFVTVVGGVGTGLHGVSVALVGAFLVHAAWTHDPDEATGLDQALREVAQAPFGRVAVIVVGVGFLVYAAHSALEARYRHVLTS